VGLTDRRMVSRSDCHAQRLRRALLHLFQQLGPVHARHPHVSDDDVERLMIHRFQGLLPPVYENHLPVFAHGVQAALQA
jgi:hypothetical protein